MIDAITMLNNASLVLCNFWLRFSNNNASVWRMPLTADRRVSMISIDSYKLSFNVLVIKFPLVLNELMLYSK